MTFCWASFVKHSQECRVVESDRTGLAVQPAVRYSRRCLHCVATIECKAFAQNQVTLNCYTRTVCTDVGSADACLPRSTRVAVGKESRSLHCPGRRQRRSYVKQMTSLSCQSVLQEVHCSINLGSLPPVPRQDFAPCFARKKRNSNTTSNL